MELGSGFRKMLHRRPHSRLQFSRRACKAPRDCLRHPTTAQLDHQPRVPLRQGRGHLPGIRHKQVRLLLRPRFTAPLRADLNVRARASKHGDATSVRLVTGFLFFLPELERSASGN